MIATITLDKAGRIVLPKRIREKMHLHEGSRLRVELSGDTLELTPEAAETRIERAEDGLPVIVGWEGFDAVQAVAEAREEYLERLDTPFHRRK